ncbi:MAG: AMP-binding protein [Bdellovibrionales bacterium]|nr:AMP-binding protein [Bdellovibrionales bacterium]
MDRPSLNRPLGFSSDDFAKKSFWTNSDSSLLLNPKLGDCEKNHLKNEFKRWAPPASLGLLSSGTESQKAGAFKMVVLPKIALLSAAEVVNQYFSLDQNLTWLNPLPLFHVGGLAICARAYLAKARLHFLENWSVDNFVDLLHKHDIALTSLVPTQIYDLVLKSVMAPASLKFVFVGGGALSKDLYGRARQLGWPLIPSYGMTETSAMLAAAAPQSLQSMEFPGIQPLPHMHWEQRAKESWAIEGPSLFSHYLFVNGDHSEWQQRPHPFPLDDRLIFEGHSIFVLGRKSELVKILGESVNLKALQEKIEKISAGYWHGGNSFIRPLPDPRKGYRLQLVTDQEETTLFDSLNAGLLPYERLDEIYKVKNLPRSPLGKILKSQVE